MRVIQVVQDLVDDAPDFVIFFCRLFLFLQVFHTVVIIHQLGCQLWHWFQKLPQGGKYDRVFKECVLHFFCIAMCRWSNYAPLRPSFFFCLVQLRLTLGRLCYPLQRKKGLTKEKRLVCTSSSLLGQANICLNICSSVSVAYLICVSFARIWPCLSFSLQCSPL